MKAAILFVSLFLSVCSSSCAFFVSGASQKGWGFESKGKSEGSSSSSDIREEGLSRSKFLATITTAAVLSVPTVAAMAQSDYSDPDKALGPLVSFQAALQKKLRPSARLPLLRTPHSYSEEWSLGAPIATVVANLKEGMDKVNSIEALKDGFLYQVDDATASSDGKTGFLQVSVLTKSRWLDVIEVKLREEEGDKCSASVSSVSTGLLPLTVPGAPLVNIVACWFPFSDLSVGQTKTLPDVRKALGVNIKVTASSRII